MSLEVVPPENWEDRALKAEALLRQLAVYIGTGPKMPHEDCAGLCPACYYEGLVTLIVESV
jgi:hypothetical protein